jgi:hypothetical protein
MHRDGVDLPKSHDLTLLLGGPRLRTVKAPAASYETHFITIYVSEVFRRRSQWPRDKT